jgi:hypothetical protein
MLIKYHTFFKPFNSLPWWFGCTFSGLLYDAMGSVRIPRASPGRWFSDMYAFG